MYPNLYYAFKDLFGIEINGLKLINSFGFFVALSFILSAWILSMELRRKQQQGLFQFTEEKIRIGEPVSLTELIMNGIMGFLFGYKIIGAFTIKDALVDPQAFILSGDGNFLTGMLAALGFGLLKWWEKKKVQLETPTGKNHSYLATGQSGRYCHLCSHFWFSGSEDFS